MSGMPTANALYNFTNGRTAGLSQQTLERICDAVTGITIDELVGRSAGRTDGHHVAFGRCSPWNQSDPAKAGRATAVRAVTRALDKLSSSLAALSIVLDAAAGNARAEATQCAKALQAIE
jgi:hypothetical protein